MRLTRRRGHRGIEIRRNTHLSRQYPEADRVGCRYQLRQSRARLAGPRDDPFFFDLNQFKAILGGTASGFNNPGTDSFAGTNVLSTIIELPKSLLGSSSSINVWAETKQKQ